MFYDIICFFIYIYSFVILYYLLWYILLYYIFIFMLYYILGVFRKACAVAHSKRNNKQLWKSTMFFWNKKELFVTCLKIHRSFEHIFSKQLFSTTLRKFLKTTFWLNKSWKEYWKILENNLQLNLCCKEFFTFNKQPTIQNNSTRSFLEQLPLNSIESVASETNVLVALKVSQPSAAIFLAQCPSWDWIRFWTSCINMAQVAQRVLRRLSAGAAGVRRKKTSSRMVKVAQPGRPENTEAWGSTTESNVCGPGRKIPGKKLGSGNLPLRADTSTKQVMHAH